ncbi:hypothetical protein GBF38_022042 [Nibea albiflora]|uniref:Uncharacterized protein n=1 Tax=Nibea albiflora TaxID=240163 RepID=A0ACB7FHJ2_NIBAL|nr:hypothetical protein GBF38_022042 [Nibea albiflora]
MGLMPRAAALEFTYRKDGQEEEGEGEGEEDNKRRAAEVSDFLRTTKEIYMSDSSSGAGRLPLLSGVVDELLSSIAGGREPATVLKQLYALKAFVRRKQTDELEKALEELHDTSSLSADETTAVVSLFRYWITDIFPMQGEKKTRLSTVHTQAYHNMSVMPPVEKTMPGMAMLLGAVGIGMCGYSSRQLALHHRPSARVLQLIGSHTDASMVGTPAHKTPFLDVNRRAVGCQEIPPPSFVGQKISLK